MFQELSFLTATAGFQMLPWFFVIHILNRVGCKIYVPVVVYADVGLRGRMNRFRKFEKRYRGSNES